MKAALALVIAAASLRGQLAIVSPADEQERRIVEERFASSAPGDQAWGAYLAANYRQRSFVPRITELLSSPDWSVREAALDALIRLRAEVQDAVLAPLAQEHFDAVLILASFEPRRHADFLLALLDQNPAEPGGEHRWLVVNSVLADLRRPEHASRLLQDWTLRLHITVTRPLGPIGIGSSVSGGYCADGGLAPPRPGFPPLTSHFLKEGTWPGAVAIAGGAHPVSYPGDGCGLGIDREQYRLDYLRWMAGSGPLTELPPEESILTWSDAGQYRADANALLDRMRRVITDLRARLIARGALDPDDGAAWPTLQVTVSDQRGGRTAALPVIDWGF